MNAKEFRSVLFYFCNRWSQDESNLIFNGKDFDINNWKYSMGEYMWNKWINAYENHNGPIDCISSYIFDIDNNCLQKFINRTEEIYGTEAN
jgi:hypothetical protein